MSKVLRICYTVIDFIEVSDDTTEEVYGELAEVNATEIGLPWCDDIEWELKEEK